MEDNAVLSLIADNFALFDAVKKVITDKFDVSSMLNGSVTVDNQRLGEIVRARLEGLAKVEEAFRDIANCKSTVSPIQRVAKHR